MFIKTRRINHVIYFSNRTVPVAGPGALLALKRAYSARDPHGVYRYWGTYADTCILSSVSPSLGADSRNSAGSNLQHD